jgi:hypothetical protein
MATRQGPARKARQSSFYHHTVQNRCSVEAAKPSEKRENDLFTGIWKLLREIEYP